MEAKDILVYIEVRDEVVHDVSYQLLSLAQTLKEQYKHKGIEQSVLAALCGHNVEKHLDDCYKYGADKVVVIDDVKLAFPSSQHTTKALVGCIEKYRPEVFLIGATVVGRDIAPRVAATVRTGLTADAIKIEVDPAKSSNMLLMTRPAFGGNLYATIICPHTYPQMSSIRPDVFEKKEFNCPSNQTERLSVEFEQKDDVKIVERVFKEKNKVDLRKANVIVAAGRSMADHVEFFQDTAKKLNGSFAASRGLVETGKVVKDVQVGQTGTTVKPSIYIACGISGAVQHTAGMDQSQTIIAINTDPNAAIFGVSTLGIVADAKEVMENLIKYL